MIFKDFGIQGLDVSFYQDNDSTPQQINFVKMKNYGISFVIIKCGQWYWRDPDFNYNWEHAKLAGIPRGSYWFCDDSDTGVNQARRYWDFIKHDVGEGIHFADFEGGSWTNWNQLYNFMHEFQQLSGFPNHRIGVYTGYYFWRLYGPNQQVSMEWFAKYPLWLAWYTDNPNYVLVPPLWNEALIWQDGTPSIGFDVGVESKEVDHNRFNGDTEKFKYYFGASPVGTPPQTGVDMKGTVLSGYVLVIRDSAGADTGMRLNPGDTVYGQVADGRIYFDRIYRHTGSIQELVGNAATQDPNNTNIKWMLLENIGEPIEPVEDKPVKVTVEMASGKVYQSTDLSQL